ncbi:type II secretion system secretin GspD [Alcaligenaceae bacterium LF4-65]|uniref:Type II secretion system secretin GspD n=1 Tax=Zwartia hollandica TaxID=324606 RepID=A0A953NEP4_9BURK|nr:type II secretion system secretin GspD [Zwartia hollandica]MBZ1351841.1 type II secretion system secretin GspD [Zwartia hollandica]
MFRFFKNTVTLAFIVFVQQNCFAQSNGINLSFNNADVEAVISTVARATNRSIVVDPKVRGKISLNSSRPLTPDQALDSLSTALRMNGFALVNTAGGYRVVTEADAKLQSSQTYSSKTDVTGDQIITRIFHLNFASAANVVNILRPLIAPNNTINALPGNNSILVTDYASNLERIEKIIQSVDNPSATKVETIALKNAQAAKVASLVNRALETSVPQGGDPISKPTVLADPRTNSLIVRSGNAERLAQIRRLVATLDTAKNVGSVYVVPLKNAEASQLAITLRALVAADSSSTDPTNTNVQGNANLSAQAPNPIQGGTSPINLGGGVGGGGANPLGAGMSAAASTALTSSSSPSTGGIIQADPNTNSLIITATEPVFKDLMKVIAQLDRRRAQVYIESMIVELTDANAAELGVQWQALNSSNTAFAGTNFTGPTSSGNTNIIGASAAINALLGTAAAGTVAAVTPVPTLGLGINIGSITNFGSNLAFSSLLRAISTISGANVLSTPNLMTLDNEEARIIVGQNIPIVTGSYAQTGSTSTVTPFQTFTRQDVGLTLRVRPQVSENGTVKLQIFQEVSSIQSVSNATGIILNKRNVESNVIVEDGQIIVLGGLIGDNYTDGSSKIPWLGDLPLIGGLFRYDNKSRTRTNLMVFIRPSVLRNNEQINTFSNNKLDDLEEKRKTFVQAPLLLPKENLNTASLRDIRDIMHDIAP